MNPPSLLGFLHAYQAVRREIQGGAIHFCSQGRCGKFVRGGMKAHRLFWNFSVREYPESGSLTPHGYVVLCGKILPVLNQGGLLTRCERIARGLVIISFSWPFMVVLFIRRTGSSLWMDLGLTRWILGGHETSTRCPTAEAQCPITATVPQQCHASATSATPPHFTQRVLANYRRLFCNSRTFFFCNKYRSKLRTGWEGSSWRAG